MLVVLHHSHPYFAGINNFKLPAFFDFILQNGDKGVTLFFLMSAYTLCLSLDRKKETEISPVRNYFLRRVFRIVPLYYFTIILILLVRINSPSLNSITANVLFIHGLSPNWINSTVPGGWSVGIEVLFYLVFPFMFFRIQSVPKAINVTLLFMLIAKVVTSLMFKNPPIADGILWGVFTYENIVSQLPVFLTGICLYLFSKHKQSENEQPALYKSYCLVGLLVIFHLAGGNILKDHYLFAIAFGLLAYGLSGYPSPVLVNKFTVWIGKLSYSIYLTHLIISHLLVKYHLNHYNANASAEVLIRFMIILSISVCISWVTYTLIEVPFQNMGKRLIKKLEVKSKTQLTKVAL